MKKALILITISLILIGSLATSVFANEPSMTVNVRIEGKDGNLFYDQVTTNNSKNYNILNMLMLADSKSDTLVIEGIGYGYITAINGVKVGEASSAATYNIRVNGEYVAYEDVSSYPLKNGDSILVYYGDEYGKGVMMPIIDTKKIEQGYIKFTCEVPTEDGSSVVTKDIVGATVTWYCDEVPFTYVTDAHGGFYIDKNALTSGSHKLTAELADENGVPLMLRPAPDYTVDVPVGIGDSFAVYAALTLSVLSLATAIAVATSLKKKKVALDN